MRFSPQKTASWLAPTLVGASFVAAAALAERLHDVARLAIPAVGAISTLAAAWGGYLVSRRGHSRREALLHAVTPAMLAAGAFGCFLIAESRVERIGIAVTSVALLGPYLSYLRGIARADARFDAGKFSQLSFAVHVASMFFTSAFLAETPGYLGLPLPAAVAVVGAVALAASAETLRRAGHSGNEAALLGATAAALVMQLFAALSFLPTAGVVNAAALTALYAAGLRAAAAHLSDAPVVPRALRRDFAFSFVLVAIVLSTARWG